MKGSGIGGQAVMEGVMMKNGDRYAVAVRTPDNEITVDVQDHKPIGAAFSKVPIIRGVVAFIDSLVLGIKTLTYSSSFYEEEEPSEKKELSEDELKKKERDDKLIMTGTVCLSVVFAVGIFMLLPYFLSRLLKDVISSAALLALIEGVIRVALFVGYVAAISLMKDIKRVFMYHGAEHKSINCIEHGLPLTVENVRTQSRQHRRCGTSFLLIVMLISVVLFMFIRVDNAWLRVLIRLLLVPIIAGIAYEFIKLAGRSNSKVVEVLSKPGLALQNLTTREPDDSMIECAIASVEAVFDWKDFLEHYNDEPEKESEVSKETSEPVVSEAEPVEAAEAAAEEPKKAEPKKEETQKKETKKKEPKKVEPKSEEPVWEEAKVATLVAEEPKKEEPKKEEPKKKDSDDLDFADEPFLRRAKQRLEEASKAISDKENGIEEEPKKKASGRKSASAKKAEDEKVRAEIKKELMSEPETEDQKSQPGERIDLRSAVPIDDDEDDEILKALDQFFILKQKKDSEKK